VRPVARAPLNDDTLFVCPTALKAGDVLRQSARRAGALVGHGVTTFPQLTELLARDLGVAPRVLSPQLAIVVLEHACGHVVRSAELGEGGQGLLHELLGVIEELEAAGLNPANVAAIASDLESPAAARRMGTIADAYAAYQTALERLGATDRHGREWAVADALATALAAGTRPRSLVGVRRIVFAEIYDFSVLQFLLATTLIRLIGDAELVAFSHPENVDATRFLDRTWNRFVAAEPIADAVLPAFVARGGRAGSLAAALRGVFAPDRPPPAPSDGTIRLLVAPHRYGEVEAVGRAIRVRLERGESAERIAVLARDLTVYGDLVRDVARRFGIPVHFRHGTPLLAAGVIKACLNVLACALDGFPRERLEQLVDSDYFRIGHPRLLRLLREIGFIAEPARPLADCLAHAGADADWAGRLLALVGTLRVLDAERSIPAHVASFRRTLRRLGVRPVAYLEAGGTVARRDAHAWAQLDETLAALAGLARGLGTGRVPLREFARQLVAALELEEIPAPAARGDAVRVLSVLDARGLDFDVVYLLGLDDGTFPAPRPESPLCGDALKRAINPLAARQLRARLGARAEGLPLGALLRTAREASLEDPFLFFLALSMAERALVLTMPAVDERGNPTLRSPFVEEVDACLTGGLVGEELDPTEIVPAAQDCAEAGELIARTALERWAGAARGTPTGLGDAVRAELKDGAERLAAIDRRAVIEHRRARYFLAPRADRDRREALADAWVGRLATERPHVAAHLAAGHLTPTDLERLGMCGFKFFAARVLGLREARTPALEVAGAEQGTLFHALLAGFVRMHPELPPDAENARALARAYVAAARAESARVIPPKDAAFLDLTWERVTVALDAFIAAEHAAQCTDRAAGYRRVSRLEERVAFDLPGTGLRLHISGRADRVDVLARDSSVAAVRVLDYKTVRDPGGYRARLDPARDLGRTSFQIPVYLLGALAETTGVTAETTLEGGFVFLLADAGDQRLVTTLGSDVLAEVALRARALVTRAGEGRFDVDPAVCDPWCAYRTVCRYQPPPLEDEATDG